MSPESVQEAEPTLVQGLGKRGPEIVAGAGGWPKRVGSRCCISLRKFPFQPLLQALIMREHKSGRFGVACLLRRAHDIKLICTVVVYLSPLVINEGLEIAHLSCLSSRQLSLRSPS
jgi:hypothetical protein